MIYAYQAARRRGRPSLYGDTTPVLALKKEALFENKNTQTVMDIVNLAYNFHKISKEERDIASFVQSLMIKVEKGLGIKRIPSSAPHTWAPRVQSVYHNLQNVDEEIKMLQKIKLHLNAYEISSSFLKLITSHHSYEELMSLKNNFQLMNTLKKGLATLQQLINHHGL